MVRYSLFFKVAGTSSGWSASFWRAVKLGLMHDWKGVMRLMKQLSFSSDSCCYEKFLLDGFIMLCRNEVGDLRQAISVFRRIRKSLERYELSGRHRLAVEIKYVLMFYAVSLYAEATCLYYAEKDLSSLKIYGKCLKALKECNAKSICGVVRLRDIQHKIDALVFVHDSHNGFRRAQRMVHDGDYDSATKLLKQAIKRIGLDFMDHDVLILAAKACLAKGNVRKARTLACSAYKDAPQCQEAQFVFALALFNNRSSDDLRSFVELTESFADNKSEMRCQMSFTKRNRMKMVIDDLRGCTQVVNHDVRLMIEEKSDFLTKGRLNISKCLKFVYGESID